MYTQRRDYFPLASKTVGSWWSYFESTERKWGALLWNTWRLLRTGHRSESGRWSRVYCSPAPLVFVLSSGLGEDWPVHFVCRYFRTERQNGDREGSQEGKNSAPCLSRSHPERCGERRQVDPWFGPVPTGLQFLVRNSSIYDSFYFHGWNCR